MKLLSHRMKGVIQLLMGYFKLIQNQDHPEEKSLIKAIQMFMQGNNLTTVLGDKSSDHGNQPLLIGAGE